MAHKESAFFLLHFLNFFFFFVLQNSVCNSDDHIRNYVYSLCILLYFILILHTSTHLGTDIERMWQSRVACGDSQLAFWQATSQTLFEKVK